MFYEYCKLITLYLTAPVTTATAERSFSVLNRIKTYLRCTMSQQRLNHVIIPHIHKDKLDLLDLKSVCSDFISKNENRKTFFGAVWFYYVLDSFYFLSSCSVILRYFLFYLKKITHYKVITLIQNQNLARRRMASSIEKIWWASFSHYLPDIISLENWAYPRLKSFRRLWLWMIV